MIDFIRSRLSEGCIPIRYTCEPFQTHDGKQTNLATFRWRRYLNSRFVCIKDEYGVSDEENLACVRLLARAMNA